MRKTRKGGGANNYGINKKELTNAIRRMSNTNGFQKNLNTMKAKINSMNGRRGVTRSNWVPNESLVTNNRNRHGSQQQTQNQLQKNANQLLSPNVPIGRQMPNKKNIHAAINQGNLVQAATMLNDSNPGQNENYTLNANTNSLYTNNEGNNYTLNANGNPISLITSNNGSAVNARVYNGNESTNSLSTINEGNEEFNMSDLYESPKNENYTYPRNASGNPISLITNNGSAVNANRVYNGNESTNSLSTIHEGNNMSDLYESPENLRQEQSAGGCGCGLKFGGKRRTRKRLRR